MLKKLLYGTGSMQALTSTRMQNTLIPCVCANVQVYTCLCFNSCAHIMHTGTYRQRRTCWWVWLDFGRKRLHTWTHMHTCINTEIHVCVYADKKYMHAHTHECMDDFMWLWVFMHSNENIHSACMYMAISVREYLVYVTICSMHVLWCTYTWALAYKCQCWHTHSHA